MLDILCVGVTTIDEIAEVPRMPGDDERVIATEIVAACGGPAATAAVAAARLGCTVGFAGRVGADPAGEQAREDLAREGVNVEWLRRIPGGRTAKSLIFASSRSASRTIVTLPAQGLDVPLSFPPARWIHVDHAGYLELPRALAHSSHRPSVSLDGGNPITDLDLRLIDVYAPSATELMRAFPGRGDLRATMRWVSAQGPSVVVATDGANGSSLYTDGAFFHVPAVQVPIRSTLGAGDVFHGALVAQLALNYSALHATQRATVAAALSCAGVDGRSAIPDASRLEAACAELLPRTHQPERL